MFGAFHTYLGCSHTHTFLPCDTSPTYIPCYYPLLEFRFTFPNPSDCWCFSIPDITYSFSPRGCWDGIKSSPACPDPICSSVPGNGCVARRRDGTLPDGILPLALTHTLRHSFLLQHPVEQVVLGLVWVWELLCFYPPHPIVLCSKCRCESFVADSFFIHWLHPTARGMDAAHQARSSRRFCLLCCDHSYRVAFRSTEVLLVLPPLGRFECYK